MRPHRYTRVDNITITLTGFEFVDSNPKIVNLWCPKKGEFDFRKYDNELVRHKLGGNKKIHGLK